jgi:sugar phosphate isomerase/epimerase
LAALTTTSAVAATGSSALARHSASGEREADPLFDLSLAQWSLHRSLREGKLDNLEFAAYTKNTFDIAAVEYVNQFFADKATDFDYLGEMKTRAADAGVESLLIMVDGEGALADADGSRRQEAISNHYKWVVAASFLGCHSIRVNAAGTGEREEQSKRAAESLVDLAEFGDQYEIDVIVENHGGLSSDGEWLAGVMKHANHPGVGTLPDFGNFHVGGGKWYDRYKGVAELMPYAKAVSAKSHEFDAQGQETKTDFLRMMKIVLGSGYRGHVGIEYEGGGTPEPEGIRLTRDLLLRVRDELS